MNRLMENIDYNFSDESLLEKALTHPSLYKETNIIEQLNYEKLEFLGDSVLNLIITKFLLDEYANEDEGSLAKRRAALVNGKTLASIAKKINLGSFMIMASGEDASGGRENIHNLENCLEALIGAIYVDTGLNSAYDFINRYWFEIARNMEVPPSDPKTLLQEFAQKSGKPIPKYSLIDATGSAHQPIFTMKVEVEDFGEAIARALSKKEAERQAATILLKRITLND